MGDEQSTKVRSMRVSGLVNDPNGRYVYGEDVIALVTTIAMIHGLNLSRELSQLRELMDS